MEEMLNFDKIKNYIEKLKFREVKIYIPKFKMATKYNLKEDMEKLGMVNSFSNLADFSRMVDKNNKFPPFIGEIIHKAFLGLKI